MKKALIGMSGGVDSSVAVYLLKKQGFECEGVTLALHSTDGVEDAKAVALNQGISHRVVDATAEFDAFVKRPFITAYDNALTPNPCIECNRHVKFKTMFDIAKREGFSHVATGHYARIEFKDGRYLLKKGADEKKDQSYVLYALTQDELSKLVFPLGEMTKADIREIAQREGFVNAKKGDSQDICFIPDGDYAKFILENSSNTYPEGDFVDLSGKVLGRHRGIIRYTIGQRKGLGLALPQPMYVCEKDLENNRVVLGLNTDLFSTELFAKNLNWIAFDSPTTPFKAQAKIRYSHSQSPCTVYPLEDGGVKVVFDEPQRAITKGQAVVFYNGDTVLGGGEIEK